MKSIAILYQAQLPPVKDGIQKPMKPGGYSDSGADIACELKKNATKVVVPVTNPNTINDLDWVFPDTKEGIQKALKKGANTLWLNTVLYKNHEIENFFGRDIEFIGQTPSQVDIFDDKYFTNQLLRKRKFPIPSSERITMDNLNDFSLNIDFPLVLKPIRGRGSQGVSMVKNARELSHTLKKMHLAGKYGDSVYAEQFLSGQEITITVMPAGNYLINNQERDHKSSWSLPAVKRFNHVEGIAPYNGIVAVMKNSSALEKNELKSSNIVNVCSQCEKAADLLNIKAPIRIDCRADEQGNYFLFDLNLKPNMTGPSRPHRANQDSLTLLAAKQIGWNYKDLLKNMLRQAWKEG